MILYSRVCQSQCKHILKVKELYLVLLSCKCLLSTSPTTTDYGHPDRAFFQKFETFGLGQTNWAEIL